MLRNVTLTRSIDLKWTLEIVLDLTSNLKIKEKFWTSKIKKAIIKSDSKGVHNGKLKF